MFTKRMVCLLLCLCFFLFCGCTKSGTKKEVERTENRYEGSSFSLPIPTGWEGKGNQDKLFYQLGNETTFLLVGGNNRLEDALREDLPLFFSTRFYASKLQMEIEEECILDQGREEHGRIHNLREDTTWYFSGYEEEDGGFFIYLTEEESERDVIEQYAATSLAGWQKG